MTDSIQATTATEKSELKEKSKTNWFAVTRDAIIAFALTFLGGFVIGLSRPDPSFYMLAIAASNLIFLSIGFVISGCLAKNERFKHLIKVALVVWALGLINILFGVQFKQWIFSIIFILVSMAIGGGISFLFVKSNKTV